MKITTMSCTIALFACLAACDASSGVQADAAEVAAPSATTDPNATVAAGCIACHQGSISLAGKASEVVADDIRAIVAGTKTHPPVALNDTSEAAVRALAESLTTPE